MALHKIKNNQKLLLTYPDAYFASLNTSDGFKSYFSEVFSGLDRLYVIKGAPGTGKFFLMKNVAAKAVQKGLKVEYFYCSSDPFSLDGIIIPELRFGMLDGTAPHTFDPHYPGAWEEIINLGDFWNKNYLIERKKQIKELSDKKSNASTHAYGLLHAAGKIRAEEESIIESFTDKGKIAAFAARVLKEYFTGNGFSIIPRNIEAIGMEGVARFSTFEKSASKVLRVTELYGSEYAVTSAFLAEAVQRSLKSVVSYSPLSRGEINGLFLPECGIAVVIGEPADNEKAVNMRRFVCVEKVSENKNRLKFLSQATAALESEAIGFFGEAKKYHFELEKIYGTAMNFPAKEKFTDKFISEVFDGK